ncbi:MAG: hypothetical protein HY702_02620, partial [Gemmatimonadetes bacterium]|nr:hypothetical protein [Gemmatimonadota bacterium]
MTEPRRPLFGRIRAIPLVRVLLVYAAASWVVLQVVAIFGSQFGLPTWFFPATVALLLIGLPIILGTAVVQDWLRHAGEHVPIPDLEIAGEREAAVAPVPVPASAHPLSRWLTWKKSILGGVLAFTALGIVGTVVVLRGTGRVTEAYGVAGAAFGARSRILVTDFEAPPDEPDIAAPVREALTVDLQQSRHVNVYGRSQIAGLLRLMQLPDTVRVSEQLGLEIGQREGLAAVLAGRISRLGDNYVLSARVLRPSTGEELIAVRTTAARERVLEAVEALSREVRSRLGESRVALRASRPLPQVTTRSLEALQRYAQAEDALARGDQEQAIDLAEVSIALDPEFAMAYRLAGVAHRNLLRFSEAERYTTRAYELRDKLSERERLHIEARYAEGILEDASEAITKYELVLSRYPDDSRAANNLAVNAWYLGDYQRAYQSALRAVELDPYTWQGYSNAISSAHRLAYWPVADSLARLAMSRGLTERATRFLWRHVVAQGDWARADALCDSLLASTPVRSEYRGDDEGTCGILDMARGRIGRATERLRRAAEIRSGRGQLLLHYATISNLVQAELLRGRRGEAQAALKQALAEHPLDSILKPDWFRAIYFVASAAAQLGDLATAERLAAAYAADTTTWDRAAWLLRLQAAVALAAGAYDKALDYDRRAVRRHFGNAVAYDQLYRAQAFDGLPQRDSAIVLYEEVASPQS